MPEMLPVGSLRLDGALLTAILSVAAGLCALRVWFWRIALESELRLFWMAALTNMCLISLIGWKLAFLIDDPSLLWNRPSSLILLRGSASDAAALLLAAVIYLLILIRRRRIPMVQLLDILPYAVLPGCFVWELLWQTPYLLPYASLVIVIYIVLIRTPEAAVPGSGKSSQLCALGLGYGGLLVSLFTVYPPSAVPLLILGLTRLQWIFIALAGLGALLQARNG
ncbi:hypothetical protein ACFPYJ_22735 [Paenibacillus solisilvae]|uniref:Prolipoprotein diacylglyceryl transferase n=1 Tax=Paenibacillus solisilvae TaxID=2486751 RepID=A0ABW0W156_9BACL